jgi:hypothetical protein
MNDNHWNGLSMQEALLGCEIVEEARITDAGPGPFYYLKLGAKVVPLGVSEHFAKCLQFALVRNAKAFEHRDGAGQASPDRTA